MASTGERRVRAAVLAAVAVLSACVGLSINSHRSATAAPGVVPCADNAALSRMRASEVTGHGQPVWVLGDSYAAGFGLADPSKSWPRYLSGRVHVDGFGGSGFTPEASPCGAVDYGSRVGRVLAAHPRVVVVEGGLNDVWSSPREVTQRAAGVIRRLRAGGVRVVVVGPAMGPARAKLVPPVDAALAAACRAEGVRYVRASGWHLPYLPDRLHLTVAGHREFGQRVAAAVSGYAASRRR